MSAKMERLSVTGHTTRTHVKAKRRNYYSGAKEKAEESTISGRVIY